MPRSKKSSHPSTHRSSRRPHRREPSNFGAVLRRPIVQIGILVAGLVVIFAWILLANRAPAATPAEIGVDEAYAMFQQGAFLLDVRDQAEWDEFHIPGVAHIPLDELASRVNEVPRDRQIVVVCRSGNRSREGGQILLDAGFTDVYSMKGGLKAWTAAGYPIEP